MCFYIYLYICNMCLSESSSDGYLRGSTEIDPFAMVRRYQ